MIPPRNSNNLFTALNLNQVKVNQTTMYLGGLSRESVSICIRVTEVSSSRSSLASALLSSSKALLAYTVNATMVIIATMNEITLYTISTHVR